MLIIGLFCADNRSLFVVVVIPLVVLLRICLDQIIGLFCADNRSLVC